MVNIILSNQFKKKIKRLNSFDRKRLEKQIRKILENPEIGKPLKYRRGERALYIKPFRIIYAFKGDDLFLLKFGHRKNIYD
ncbi:type II toxin-antitoxin system RelE/ParE family toxin [Candidatus Pacearchaeota archaeon]|nr:type II toxin-antitoxin system RelE/ParE family toxin [Candidatus Pacearchaeota archaeon]